MQNPPVPKTLCQSAGDGGNAVDSNGDPKPTSYSLGDIPAIQKNAAGQENEGQTVLTNGKNVGGRTATQGDPPGSPMSALGAVGGGASVLDVQPGQGLRLQLVNAATTRYMRLRLTKPDGTLVNLVRVGGEGGLLNNATLEGGTLGGAGGWDSQFDVGEILLPPGTRADVVAAIPTAPTTGVMTLWTEDFQRVGLAPNWSNLPTVPVMHLNLTGATVNPAYTIPNGTPLRAATGDTVQVLPLTATTLLPADGFAPAKIGKKAPVLPITLNAGGTAKIDNVTGSHDVADYATAPHQGPAPPGDGSTRYARLGQTLQLTVKNNTGAHHPFHLHGFSIQPKTLVNGGATYTFPNEYRDNVDVPPGYTLTYRVKLEDRAKADGTTTGGGVGRWVFHCHIFFHATLGMISELVVLPAGLPANNGQERPTINTDVTAVNVSQGQTAQFTGTFNDINGGDFVALSSSVGTMTKNGGNNYTWSFDTGTAPSQFVYVTATDLAGATAQLPVELRINNTPPALTLPVAQSVPQGAQLAFNLSGNDPDAVDPLALTASGLPAGLALKDNGNRTGSVSGQVTAEPGSYQPQFFVNDGRNAPVGGNLQITVTQPVMTALIDKTERMSKRKITLGCQFVLPSITSCDAVVKRSGKEVGRAASTSGPGQASLNVGVPLDATIRRAIGKSIRGVPVSVTMGAARANNGTPFSQTGNTRVIAPKIRLRSPLAFRPGTSALSKRGRAFIASLVKRVPSAKGVVCTGHPDRRSRNRRRAEARGQAMCAALQAAGLKSKFTAKGSRARHTRRVDITITR
jgi:FtsP/CotA-like multicopper oxidase with cupredoxin domain